MNKIKPILAKKDEYLKIRQEMCDCEISAMKESYIKVKNIDIKKYTDKLKEFGDDIPSNSILSAVREYEIIAMTRLLTFNAALRKHYIKNNSYPANLEVLGITGEKSIDPFSGKPFIYKIANGKPIIYSIGPDLKDDNGAIIYDAKTGANGSGDIVVSF